MCINLKGYPTQMLMFYIILLLFYKWIVNNLRYFAANFRIKQIGINI